jgi:hypothetical protein
MSRQYKCGYCGLQGHTIGHCNSPQGNQVLEVMRSRAIDYITSRQDQPINSRAMSFYEHLKSVYYVKELRFILSKLRCSTNGTKSELSARIIHEYFYLFLLIRNPNLMAFEERSHANEYVKYWWHISIGISFELATIELDEYFEFVVYFNKQVEEKIKIKVFMEPIDLTDESEKENVKPKTFQSVPFQSVPFHSVPFQSETFDCAICMEDECSILKKVNMGCNHSFCKDCVISVMMDSKSKEKHPCCALCRRDYTTMCVRTYEVLKEINTHL